MSGTGSVASLFPSATITSLGASVGNGGAIRVNGRLTIPAGGNYVVFVTVPGGSAAFTPAVYTVMAKADGMPSAIEPGFLEYTDGDSYVWVRITSPPSWQPPATAEEEEGDGEDVGGSGEHTPVFKDVDPDLWYYEYIKFVVENNIMQGTSADTFQPDIALTRAMMVQILYNLEGKPESGGTAAFDDVPAGAWFTDAVAWASANGIVNGYGDGTFGPNDNITREQLVVILYRYAGYKEYDTSAAGDLGAFTDAGSTSAYAAAAMKWAVGSGLVNGRDFTHIVPQGTATRAEVAAVMARFCKYYVS